MYISAAQQNISWNAIKIAIIDHEKRTFVVRKGGLPDASIVN
jgi:hypothetical protein